MPRIFTDRDGVVQVERFSLLHRVEHAVLLCCVALLVVTGFSQKFYGSGWAPAVLHAFGGLYATRKVHHIAGLAFSFLVIQHLCIIAVGMVREKMGFSLFPTAQDLRSMVATMQYDFGYAKVRPKQPKFDYRQKFEYLGLLLGALLMMGSGLALLFPELVSGVFSGQVIPTAWEAHSNDALLTFMVLVGWHLYGAHLAPSVFPMNKSIFTGVQTKEHLARFHGLEYERIFGEPAELVLTRKT